MWGALTHWNTALFYWINASASPPWLTRVFAIFAAQGLIYLLALGLVYAWARGPSTSRVRLLYALLCILLGLGMNQAAGLLWYEPRPFALGIGHTLVAHALENSFPSDHAVVFFAAAMALLRFPESRYGGLFVMSGALLVAWSRVYIGIHFPIDMLGSFSVALGSAAIAGLGLPWITSHLEPLLSRWQRWTLGALRDIAP